MSMVKVKATMQQEVYIEPHDALESIKHSLGLYKGSKDFITVKNGKIVLGEDVSYHGSPMYEYEVVSNNPKWVELYKSIECMEDYFKHCDEPQWKRVIEQDEEESPAPALKPRM